MSAGEDIDQRFHCAAHMSVVKFVCVIVELLFMMIWFAFQDGVRFYIYFDSDYELDADSVEEKNKVSEHCVISTQYPF